jgi:hypothetical protein
LVEPQFAEALRLAASIRQGTVTASLILRKLGAYARQNSLALARGESAGSSARCSRCTLWNKLYLEGAVVSEIPVVDTALLQHVSPLGWEHVGLTGDYLWHSDRRVATGGFRTLRPPGTRLSSA